MKITWLIYKALLGEQSDYIFPIHNMVLIKINRIWAAELYVQVYDYKAYTEQKLHISSFKCVE